MKPIPLNPDTERVARRIIWFEPPACRPFMAQATSYATHDDMKAVRRYVSTMIFAKRSTARRPEIIDPRPWAYWNSKFGRFPPPPMPKRRLG